MISFIYTNRNRDLKRIQNSWDSLQAQESRDFEVIFIDYGSNKTLATAIKNLSSQYQFVNYFHLPVSGLLWNKSKALNYGISKANAEYIFIADVDLIFHPHTIKYLADIKKPDSFFLFELGYLDRNENFPATFENLNPIRFGQVNGMILVSKTAVLEVNGLDEFFHFYGSEDEDLFLRLEYSGLKRDMVTKQFFYHQWHQSFIASEEKKISRNPRLTNAMRINQRHYNYHKEKKIIWPEKQAPVTSNLENLDQNILNSPDISFNIPNISAYVGHFLDHELRQLTGKTVKVCFFSDPYYKSAKYKAKMLLGRQSQAYLSLKEINDLILRKIIFEYRDSNYSFNISKDLTQIEFSIKL